MDPETGKRSQLPPLKSTQFSPSCTSEYETDSSEYESESEETERCTRSQQIKSEVAATVDDIVRRVTDVESENVLITAIDNTAEPRESPKESQRAPKYAEEELAAALDAMLKRGKLPEFEMRPFVVTYAKEETIRTVINEDYERAAKIEKAIKEMMASLRRDEASLDCDQQTLLLKNQLAAAQEQQQSLQTEFEKRITELKDSENKRLDELYERHEAERKAFEEDWARPQAVKAFSKPSSSLLQIRRMQKTHALAHDFEQAIRLKAAGDEMQREESHKASKLAQASMKVAYATLIEKQERELDCFMANGHRKLSILESERDRKLKANENLRSQLETRIKNPKQPRKPRGSMVSSSLDSPVIAMKTRNQFARFKNTSEPTRLTVHIDMSRIKKPVTPARAKGTQRPPKFT